MSGSIERIQCISPIDGSVYAEASVASERQVTFALDAARRAQADWAHTSIDERAKACTAIVDSLWSMAHDIIPELTWQMGRPIRFGEGELRGVKERSRYMIDSAADALATIRIPDNDDAAGKGYHKLRRKLHPEIHREIRRNPLGLLFVIAPWNYPYLTAINSIIPGLMAGNAVLLKHAPQTLLVGDRFREACDKAGLPTGLFTNLVLTHRQADALITDARVDRVHFTGSVESGRVVERAAGGSFVGVGLELGGKDPAYVRPDVDLDFAVEQLVDGSFFNSGQSCCAVERIYVHESVYQRFVDAFVDVTTGYVLDNPLNPETSLGPMISPGAAAFVRGQISMAVEQGARTLIDPKTFPRDEVGTPYVAPQVVVGVTHDMSLMQEESFGPVVGIMPVANDTEAIRLMNDSRFGLTASIWTADLDAAERIGESVEAGTVFMNRCDYLDPALAWTGVKDSGRGTTLSRIGYEMLTRPKSFYFRTKTTQDD